jgi:hypothetical protein
MIPDPPRRFPPMPGWARLRDVGGGADDALFMAGAALSALHPLARDEHLLGRLWRQRLALRCAAVLAGQGGRTEDEATLRDHWYLRQSATDPGPAGRLLGAWRLLGTSKALAFTTGPTMPALLACRDDETLQEVIAFARLQCSGGGNPVRAAGATAAISLRVRPDCRPLALWLADAVLAHRLSWPAPVPLLAAHLTGAGLGQAAALGGDDLSWMQACSLAYARAAAAAWDRYAELGHRADRLLAAAPKLRGRDADTMVATLLSEDAQPARGGQTASDRSSRRLFERLVSLGVVRELTGAADLPLYGL